MKVRGGGVLGERVREVVARDLPRFRSDMCRDRHTFEGSCGGIIFREGSLLASVHFARFQDAFCAFSTRILLISRGAAEWAPLCRGHGARHHLVHFAEHVLLARKVRSKHVRRGLRVPGRRAHDSRFIHQLVVSPRSAFFPHDAEDLGTYRRSCTALSRERYKHPREREPRPLSLTHSHHTL